MTGISSGKFKLSLAEKHLDARHEPVPIVALTTDPDRDRCLEAGITDMMPKPLMVDNLRDLVHQWMKLNKPQISNKKLPE